MMGITATKENLLTIAHRLGLSQMDAEELINKRISVRHDSSKDHIHLAAATINMLSRTFTDVNCGETAEVADLVVIIGSVKAPAAIQACHACLLSDRVAFQPTTTVSIPTNTPLPLVLVSACYLVSNCVRALIPGLAEGTKPVMEITWEDVFPGALLALSNRIKIDHAVLVGAGAIGNGFAWAVSGMDIEGSLDIVDEDEVSDGNLNRNALHHVEQLNSPKAEFLKHYLCERCPKLKVRSFVERFESYANNRGEDLRVPIMITAVDSSRMRRKLQAYLPKEIYDASTGGLGDIVFHHNRYPINGACLACIHAETADEAAHETHIAEALGVSKADVQSGSISVNAAETICRTHTGLSRSDLEGNSFHSLFKQLCGAGQLPHAEREALEITLAPLCFVSVLAGVILGIELALRATDKERNYNLARISPWSAPRKKMMQWRGKCEICEFCTDSRLLSAFARIWRN